MAVRLHRLQQRLGKRLEIERRPFPLRPGPEASTRFRGTYREAAWRRLAARVAADGIDWQMWQRDDFPNWSLPALEAAQCAALQGSRAFEDMHFRLFRGFFEQGVNIARTEEILALARQAPLDYAQFAADFSSGRRRRTVLDAYEEAVNTYMIYAIPTVIFNDQERLVGAVPTEDYLTMLARFGVS